MRSPSQAAQTISQSAGQVVHVYRAGRACVHVAVTKISQSVGQAVSQALHINMWQLIDQG